MKKSITTFLKHPIKDDLNRSANPSVTRASTILFNSMQELHKHEKNIREITLFPLNQNAQDLLMDAPSSVDEEQLKELNIKLDIKKN